MKKMLILLLVLCLVGAAAAYNALGKDKLAPSEGGGNAQINVSNAYKKVRDACEIITLEDVTSVIGQTMKKGASDTSSMNPAFHKTSCVYSNITGSADDMITASLVVSYSADKTETRRGFETGKESLSSVESIKDLGDDAYYSPLTRQLNILEGNHWLILSVGNAKTDMREAQTQLAKLALDKL